MCNYFFSISNIGRKKNKISLMEILRRRLLENATKLSDFAEIFAAIDRGEIINQSIERTNTFCVCVDCSGRITFEEFRSAIKALRLGIENNDEIQHIFRQFDITNNGQIDFNEFLQQLRPPLNDRRRKAALNLFQTMDVDHDGKLTILDLKVRSYFNQNSNLILQL